MLTLKKNKHDKAEIIFYLIIVVPAFVQVCIFYFGANINSYLLAFQNYDVKTGNFYWCGFETISSMCHEIFAPETYGMWLRSIFVWAVGIVMVFISFFVSFFLYKKIPLSGFYKVMLFLPSILPSIALVLFYKNFMELIIDPTILSSPDTAFQMLMLYTVFLSFGSGMLMYCGIMSRIDSELVDAMEVDGGTVLHEFIHLAWPAVYPYITIGFYTGLISIFTASPNTYAFFGNYAPESTWTIGYYMYSKIVGKYGDSQFVNYASTSAANMLFGFIVLIPTFLLKYFFEHKDPNY